MFPIASEDNGEEQLLKLAGMRPHLWNFDPCSHLTAFMSILTFSVKEKVIEKQIIDFALGDSKIKFLNGL